MGILKACGLRKIYGSGETAVHALDGVDLTEPFSFAQFFRTLLNSTAESGSDPSCRHLKTVGAQIILHFYVRNADR